MQHKILIVEDDIDINNLLSKILMTGDYKTRQAFSGTEAELLLEREMPDLILLDLMLPGMTGEELLRKIREEKQLNIPVIILSAKNSLPDKVALLRIGADDYITKPFDLEEVMIRVQVVLRRAEGNIGSDRTLSYKNIKLYKEARKVVIRDMELFLTAHEYEILCLLIQSPEKVYSREKLYELVWDGGYYGENNTVNVHVSNLRRKLKEADPEGDYIQTVYGIGFKLS